MHKSIRKFVHKSLIRIIRNADIDIDDQQFDDDALDYRDSMEELIKVRRRLCPVKLEYSRMLDEKVIKSLCRELDLSTIPPHRRTPFSAACGLRG